MKISVNIFNPQTTMSRIFNQKVGIFTAETCARYFNPYVPMRDGFLSQGYITEPNKITYNQPYAKRQYYGDNFNFSKEQHPLATSHWNEPAMAANREKIVKEIAEYIRRS